MDGRVKIGWEPQVIFRLAFLSFHVFCFYMALFGPETVAISLFQGQKKCGLYFNVKAGSLI